jgi:L-lactate dehydrogenase complex protein LldF
MRLLRCSTTGQSISTLRIASNRPRRVALRGECHVMCPVKIPLPDLLCKLREKQFEEWMRPMVE